MEKTIDALLKHKEEVLDLPELSIKERVLHERAYRMYMGMLRDAKDEQVLIRHLDWMTGYLDRRTSCLQ